jgi:hypothetical protein
MMEQAFHTLATPKLFCPTAALKLMSQADFRFNGELTMWVYSSASF